MKSIKFLGLVLAALLSIWANGYSGLFAGFGGFDAGVIYNDRSNLNSMLTANGYPGLSDYSFTIGGSGGCFINNVYLGGTGFGNPGEAIDNGKNFYKMAGGMGFFETGYAVIHTSGFIFTPKIGIGGAGGMISLAPATITNNDFNSILQNPANTTVITYGSVALEAGISGIFRMGITSIGLNAGYIYTVNPNWTLNGMGNMGNDGQRLVNKPQLSEHSIYATLGVYFGGFYNATNKNFMKMGKGMRQWGGFDIDKKIEQSDNQPEITNDNANDTNTQGNIKDDLKKQADKALENTR
jgi:hypothetical protein